MPRRTLMSMLTFTFIVTGIYFFMQARMDAKFAAARAAIGTMTTCGTLRLGMTREDVQRVMGAPSREFQIEGPSGGAAVALRFELPIKEDRFPLAVLENGLLVEAVCTERHRLTATKEEIAAMFMRESAEETPIGSDSVRR